MNLSKAQSDFVEKVGRWWEISVGSRTAGRIIGWLMISDPTHQSSGDLVEALSISAGSVSTQVRQLEGLGIVERTTFPGDRATYYQLRPNAWVERMWGEQARLEAMVDLARAGDEVMPADRPDRVTEFGRIAEFLLAEWPRLMQRLTEHLEKERVT
ncbi:MAG: MarR family transcriptional regulator [Acidimicrobiia bacterium]|nr:MarR family transcriptional regulator [Acidimicrobiia bacterium]